MRRTATLWLDVSCGIASSKVPWKQLLPVSFSSASSKAFNM
jgi:hypothetical protein